MVKKGKVNLPPLPPKYINIQQYDKERINYAWDSAEMFIVVLQCVWSSSSEFVPADKAETFSDGLSKYLFSSFALLLYSIALPCVLLQLLKCPALTSDGEFSH